MNMDYTDITLILDRSGSMDIVKNDTIGGFNQFINEQKTLSGKIVFSLAQFDHEYEIVHNGKPIAEVPELTSATFIPRGATALYDAIGRTIAATGERLAALPEQERPGRVVFVILTDGEENASSEYGAERIKAMIEEQSATYSWAFIFLGANQDAILTAGTLGICGGLAMTYASESDGTSLAMAAACANVRAYHASAELSDLSFTTDQRNAQNTIMNGGHS